MGYATIGCCRKCEVPVQALNETSLSHVCNHCNNLWLDDDLLWLDFATASMNAQVMKEYKKTEDLLGATIHLLEDIRKAKEATHDSDN
jgi:hypothetical protein